MLAATFRTRRAMPSLLLVEDDIGLGAALQGSLQQHGFAVQWVRLAASAADLLARNATYVAVVLDVELPDGDGYDVLHGMRAAGNATPVLVLTVRFLVAERVRALNAGADDYLLKPFDVDELVARLHALMRRGAGHATPLWQVGVLELDALRRRVRVAGVHVELTHREFDVLLELMRHAGRAVSRAHLERAAIRDPQAIHSNMLEVIVHGLRRKLPANTIRTIRGVGYVVCA